jgi:hypothetical protein
MRSSSRCAVPSGVIGAAIAHAAVAGVVFASVTIATDAHADPPSSAAALPPAQGFAVNRFYPSAPGGGWLAMESLDMRGVLGAAASLTFDYAHAPLHVGGASAGARRVDVVKNQAFADFGFAVTYSWLRFYLDLSAPLLSNGNTGGAASAAGHTFTSPTLDVAQNPDTLADSRFGVDARLVGKETDAFRLGAGVQLIVPSAERSDYVSDGTYRAMARVLFAGDLGPHGALTYAGHLGVHARPLAESDTPGSPRGSELLFGAAAGWKTLLGADAGAAFVVGPEIYGATPFRSMFGGATTAIEGLFVGRVEGTADDSAQLRFKTGVGAGLEQQFGAADFRLVFAIEVFDHHMPPRPKALPP